jgi:hypothetical protein
VRYVLQATRDEVGVLTFHLIPPLTDWKPQMYAEMLADLVTHISAYTGMNESEFVRLMQEDLDRRSALAASLDPLRKAS